jgi:predicted DNA-binding transcriptional regulator AlpA
VRLGDVHDLPPTLCARQVAECYGVSVDHVYAMHRDGTEPVPALVLGRKLVWPTAAVLHALGLDVEGDTADHVVPIRQVGAAG